MRNPKETLICHIWGQEEKKEENSGLCHALSWSKPMVDFSQKTRNMQQNILLKFVFFEFVRNFAPKNPIYK